MNPDPYIGIPFMEKGRDMAGCDCWGLVRLVYKRDIGVELPSYDTDYTCTTEATEISQKIGQESTNGWEVVPADQVRTYDVILMRMLGLPMHVGIVTRKGRMLHVMHGINVTHEPYENIRWKNKILGFYRYVGG